MAIAETIISIVAGGFIGYIVKYYLDLRLVKKSEAMAKKKEFHEEIATAMRVFVSRGNATAEDKRLFLKQSSRLWLWAPDSVIRACNKFTDIMIRFNESEQERQKEAKEAYANFIIEMRKDLGFPKTTLNFDDYRFFTFGR